MKILMRTLAAGKHGVFEPGKQYDVTNEIGQPMVDGEYAAIVGSKPKTRIIPTNSKPAPEPQPPPPETTTHPGQSIDMGKADMNPPPHKPKRGRPKKFR